MIEIVNAADLVDPSDQQGRTWRQINASRQHAIPIGALVEHKQSGIRLFVVQHTRDCDQTPLYSIGTYPDCPAWERAHGYCDESLTLIRRPPPCTDRCPGCGKPYPAECDWCSEEFDRPVYTGDKEQR